MEVNVYITWPLRIECFIFRPFTWIFQFKDFTLLPGDNSARFVDISSWLTSDAKPIEWRKISFSIIVRLAVFSNAWRITKCIPLLDHLLFTTPSEVYKVQRGENKTCIIIHYLYLQPISATPPFCGLFSYSGITANRPSPFIPPFAICLITNNVMTSILVPSLFDCYHWSLFLARSIMMVWFRLFFNGEVQFCSVYTYVNKVTKRRCG